MAQKKQMTAKKTVSTEKSILVDGERISYLFCRKRIKNLNARVRPDGRLAVSAPPSASDAAVERFLRENIHRLLPAMRSYTARRETPAFALKAGAVISLFDVPRTLVFLEGQYTRAAVGENVIAVCLRPGEGEGAMRAALAVALEKTAKEELNAICLEIYSKYFNDSFPYPEICYRKMTASYGNCRKNARRITLNLRLIYAGRASAEYVVLHEFCHLLHADHSPAFWGEVAVRMPDYRVRRAALSSVPLRNDPIF